MLSAVEEFLEQAAPRGSSRRLMLLASGVIIFHVLNSIFQESIFYLPGFHHTVALAVLQSLFIALFAGTQLCVAHWASLVANGHAASSGTAAEEERVSGGGSKFSPNSRSSENFHSTSSTNKNTTSSSSSSSGSNHKGVDKSDGKQEASTIVLIAPAATHLRSDEHNELDPLESPPRLRRRTFLQRLRLVWQSVKWLLLQARTSAPFTTSSANQSSSIATLLSIARTHGYAALLPPRRCPLSTYLFISIFSTSSTVLTNQASFWLDYTTQVIFKSSKLLFIVIVRFLLIELPMLVTGTSNFTGTSILSLLVYAISFRWLSHLRRGSRDASHVEASAAHGRSDNTAAGDEMPSGTSPDHAGTTQQTATGGSTAARKLLSEVISSTFIVVGLVLFTYATSVAKSKRHGSTTASPSDVAGVSILSLLGVAAIVAALMCDAFMYIFQEKYCFKQYKASGNEVLFFVYAFATINALFTLVVLVPDYTLDASSDGKKKAPLTISAFRDALQFTQAQPRFPLVVLLCAFFNYCGSSILLRIVSEFASGSAVVVTSTRKLLTVLCSYLIYPKSFSGLHGVSVTLVGVGVWWFEEIRRTHAKASKT